MGLLEGARQGGVISKLSRTDLVGLLGKLVSVIELELLNCIRLGLEQYALPSGLYKEKQEHPLVIISYTIIELGYYAIQRPKPI